MTRAATLDDTAQWFLRRSGHSEEIGPLNRNQLSRLWHDDVLDCEDLLFAEGILPDWIPVGKLHNFLTDYTSGWKKSRPADSRVVQVAELPGAIFLIDNGQRRGPIDVDQLQALVTLSAVAPETSVLNGAGELCTTVAELLDTGILPPPRPVPLQEKRRPAEQPLQRPVSKSRAVTRARSGDARRRDRRRNREALPPAPPPLRRPEPKVRRATERSGDQTQQAVTLGRASADTRSHGIDSTIDEAPVISPSSRRGRPPERQPTMSFSRLLRSVKYSRACALWSGVLLLQSLVVLTVTNALCAMFLKRMGGLCLSTFIPFGATPEELKQEALLMAGIATVLVGLLLALPVWHLLRTDSFPWHAIAALVVGFLLGMAIKPDAVPPLLLLMRFALVAGGITMALICVWLMAAVNKARISTVLLVPLAVTIVCIAGLATCDLRELFVIDIAGLPPSLAGQLPHAGVFLVCLYAGTLAFPAFCYFVLSGEVSESVKQFMDAHLILAAAAGIGMVAFAYCLFQPQPDQFMSIPLALAPIAAVNAVVSMVPPALWMTHPENIGLR